MSTGGGRVVLVETSDLLPGLLPFQAWEALTAAGTVLCRDPATHPAAPALTMAGVPLVALEPEALGRDDLLLTRPGGPDDRRLAKALVAAARADGTAVYLLEDDERGLAPALSGMVAAHDLEIELVFLAQLPRGTELLRAAGGGPASPAGPRARDGAASAARCVGRAPETGAWGRVRDRRRLSRPSAAARRGSGPGAPAARPRPRAAVRR